MSSLNCSLKFVFHAYRLLISATIISISIRNDLIYFIVQKNNFRHYSIHSFVLLLQFVIYK